MTQAPALGARAWVLGARPRTLGAAIAPVAVGAAASASPSASRTAAALVVALGLQVGVNYANDYADGVRGVDTEHRAGPMRLVASGTRPARAVARAAGIAIGIAAVAGLWLAAVTSPWLLAVGALAIAGAVAYSGGPRPYASMGLGEVFVFAFFGLLATAGTAYVNGETIPAAAWWGAVPVGLLAVAILVVNNLRDIPTDRAAGKMTLPARIGVPATRALYAACAAGAFLAIGAGVAAGGLPAWGLLALAAAPLAIRPLRLVFSAAGRALVPALTGTALLHLAAGLLLALGIGIGR